MNIQQHVSLKKYNTFGIDIVAQRFVEITSMYELQELLKQEQDLFILSGGSNMLLTSTIEKLVVYLNIKGISIDNENDNSVHITANAGENWHEFVLWTVAQNYGGLENLSLIPGNVGSSPIQNIGAYGTEVKDTITKVEAIEINTGKLVTFSNENCEFGYRNSIFKNKVKGQYIIIAVSFELSKKDYKLNTAYGAIEKELALKKITNPTIKDISDVIVAIRKSKLPDPKELGNSGSFFKNPIISKVLFEKLQSKYVDIPNYTVNETLTKIPAGWLIEKSGFKGKRFGNCGVHEKQALVLVNYGNATGKEIHQLAKKIQKTVFDNFEIDLEIEVNVF